MLNLNQSADTRKPSVNFCGSVSSPINGYVAEEVVEVSSNGKWREVPALRINEHQIVVKGKWIKLAVVHDEEWLESDITDPEKCISILKGPSSPELRADIFSFTQKLPVTVPQYRYPMDWHSVAAIRLTSLEDWWRSLPQETRKNVRRSEKRGVVVGVRPVDDELIRGIMDVNNASPLRQGKPNTHYGKSFDEARKDHSAFADRSEFIGAYAGDEMIGFLWLVYRKDIASILQLTPKPAEQDKRPANALVAKAVELCAAKGISYLTYGMFNYGNKTNSSLRDFKIRNGFTEILVPRYYVPLSRFGRLAVSANLHRGLIGVLPPSLITVGNRVRAKYYTCLRWLKPV